MLYDPVEKNRVVCKLCRHYCKILPDRYGICSVRKNVDGKLYTLVYEKAIAANVDPIEKKPLFHIYPSSPSFSIATMGCNFHCDFCQNADIAQIKRSHKSSRPPREPQIFGENLPVEKVVQLALSRQCKTIAYTYTEPTIFFEYAYDIGRLAVNHDILNVFITNGYFTSEALELIRPYLHAANVDLKGFNQGFYKKNIGAKLENILDSLKLIKKYGIWLEVTTLVVPGYDDDEDNFKQIARFIRNELGAETPWHISRFFPHYKRQGTPPTSPAALKLARQIGYDEGLRYVYTGNLPGDDGEHTYCYQCGEQLIRRMGYHIEFNRIKDGKCPSCHAEIDGIGMDG